MEEKRHHKRLKLDVSIQLERLTEDGTTTYDYTQVVVTDVSRGGIGFQSDELLEVGGYYNTRIQIWTKEVIDAVIAYMKDNTLTTKQLMKYIKTVILLKRVNYGKKREKRYIRWMILSVIQCIHLII